MTMPSETIQSNKHWYRVLLRVLTLSLLVLAHPGLSLGKKLNITSNPPEAEVQIDGQYVGTTPLTLEIHGNEILSAGGIRWKNPAALVVSKSGCTVHRSAITRSFLDSKDSHVQLECYRSHLDAGFQFLLKAKFVDSVREYERALELDHDHFEGFFNLGMAYMGLGKYREANKAFDTAIQLKHDAPEAYNMKGLACAKLLMHSDSISSFTEALRLKPDFAIAYVNIAEQFRVSGHREEALNSVERAIQIRPDLAEAYRVKARVLEQLGRTNQAVTAAQQAFDLEPNSAGASLTLGWELDETGQPQMALEYAQRAVELNPNLREGYTNMCRAYDELGESRDAVKACQGALARSQSDPQSLFYGAVAYEKLGQSRTALVAYRRAAAAFKEDPEPDEYALFLWGNACFRLARFQQAVEHYEKAIQERPDFAPAHLNIGVAYIRLGQREKAANEYNILRATDSARAQTLKRLLDLPFVGASLKQESKNVVTRPSVSQLSPMAIIKCNADCTISFDNTWKQPLFAGRSQSFPVVPGKHTISAISADGRRSWRTSVVWEKNSRKEIVVPVEPKTLDVREETERKELLAEIAQARARIDANRRKTADVSSARTRLLINRGSLKERKRQLQQRAESIVNQIKVYEVQVDPELKQAEHDDNGALKSCSQGGGGNDTFSALKKAADTTACIMSKQSAERHRQRAKEFLMEIDKLSHELYSLTKPQ